LGNSDEDPAQCSEAYFRAASHSQYGFALKVIKIDRRFADVTFAGD
jgi:hypothetical protein